MKRISLPVLILNWIKSMSRSVENRLFRSMLMKHGVSPDSTYMHVYWMNIVRPVGGREKMKPCEYFFSNPWHARMHEEICKTCMTWEYITTVKIFSKIELTTTDYQKLVEEDEDFQAIISEMQCRSGDSKQEYEDDRVEYIKSSRR